MIIDKKKQYGVFKLEKRKTLSDHNAMLLKQNVITATKNRIVTECGILVKCGKLVSSFFIFYPKKAFQKI